MNIKKLGYSTYNFLQGKKAFKYYKQFLQEANNIPTYTTKELLVKLLEHCQKSVPYYANIMSQVGNEASIKENPELYIQKLPILTKDIIRANFEQLKSQDINQRQWHFEHSGGSTGEPIKLIQDQEYLNKMIAIKWLYSYLVSGRDIGEPEIRFWSSKRDILGGTIGWTKQVSNFLTNTIYMNAFQRLDASVAKDFIHLLNRKRPKLITAYTQAMYELAKIIEAEKIPVTPQKAIITSAEPLYPWMREKIENVFQCKVFNRYGSREVGDIACERPGYEGLWVAPWGNYIEIVDDNNNPLPPGSEGTILVTCLNNFAMPLIRYKIGDRGILSPLSNSSEQILQEISGRTVDIFKTSTGDIVPGGYFVQLLEHVLDKNKIKRTQVIQKNYHQVELKIAKYNVQDELDLAEAVKKIKFVMGEACEVKVHFVDDIPTSSSGKHRYTISEVI